MIERLLAGDTKRGAPASFFVRQILFDAVKESTRRLFHGFTGSSYG